MDERLASLELCVLSCSGCGFLVSSNLGGLAERMLGCASAL